MKKVLKIASWVLFVAGTFVLLAFADVNYKAIDCTMPSISIDKSTGHDFVTKEMVLEKLNDIGYSFLGQEMGEIEIDRIEKILTELPGAKAVEAYKNNDGVITIEIEQRRPVARVITINPSISYYLDSEGKIMPLSQIYTAKVPIFNGEIKESSNLNSAIEIMNSDSLSKLSLLDDIYEVAMAFQSDDFMAAQIVQIYVNSQKEFEMIPRVGNHRIMFGDGSNAHLKMNKLNKFYTEVIEPKELNLYDTLNVKYVNQIICSKR